MYIARLSRFFGECSWRHFAISSGKRYCCIWRIHVVMGSRTAFVTFLVFGVLAAVRERLENLLRICTVDLPSAEWRETRRSQLTGSRPGWSGVGVSGFYIFLA